MLESYFDKYGHKCTIDLDEPFKNLLENKSKLQKWFIKYAVISQNRILLRSRPRSLACMRTEILYQMENYPYTLHPFSDLTYYLDLIWMLVAFIWFIISPLIVFEHIEPEPVPIKQFIYVEVIFSAILLMDCFRRFFSGRMISHNDSDEIVLDYRSNAIYYLKSYFLIDFIPSIPPLVLLSFDLHPNHHLVCDLLTMLRIFRLASMNRVIINVMRYYHFNHNLIDMFSGTVFILFIVHWVSIFSVILGIIERRLNPNIHQWFDDLIEPNSVFMSTYFLCYHRTLAILTGRGYYLILEKKVSEIDLICTIFIAILGHILTLLIFAKLFEIVNSVGSASAQYEEMWNEISNYMKHHNLSKETQKKIKTYYTYKYQYSYFTEYELIRALPNSLQQNIIMHNSKLLLDNMGYLRELPATSVANIVARMAKEILLAGDVVVRSGDSGAVLFFVLSGTIAIFTRSGWEICHQEDGSEFGECAVLNSDKKHICTAVAIETTEVYKLHAADFFALLDYCPDIVGLMEKVANNRNKIEDLIDQRLKQIYIKNITHKVSKPDGNSSESSQRIWKSPEGSF